MHLSIMKLIMKIGMIKDRFVWSTQQDLDYHDDIVQIYIYIYISGWACIIIKICLSK